MRNQDSQHNNQGPFICIKLVRELSYQSFLNWIKKTEKITLFGPCMLNKSKEWQKLSKTSDKHW